MRRFGIIGLPGDFDVSIGRSMQKYMHELYSNMVEINHDKDTRIEKILVNPMAGMGSGIPFMLGSMFRDFDGYDVVHNPDFKPFIPLRKGRAIQINTLHDAQYLLSPELNRDMTLDMRGLLRLKVVIPLDFRSVMGADYVIVTSTVSKADALSIGIDRRRIFVISQGLDSKFLAAAPRKKKSGRFKVGYIGTFRTRKNVMFAIDAFKSVESRNATLQLWGRQIFEYERIREAARKDARIDFAGFAPEARIVGTYDSFDAFIFPSLYEGFGVPILEAQARGLPVITYGKGRLPREVTRYSFKAKDEEDAAAIIDRLAANGYDEKARRRAMAYARSFTWRKTAERTLGVYEKVSSK